MTCSRLAVYFDEHAGDEQELEQLAKELVVQILEALRYANAAEEDEVDIFRLLVALSKMTDLLTELHARVEKESYDGGYAWRRQRKNKTTAEFGIHLCR